MQGGGGHSPAGQAGGNETERWDQLSEPRMSPGGAGGGAGRTGRPPLLPCRPGQLPSKVFSWGTRIQTGD